MKKLFKILLLCLLAAGCLCVLYNVAFNRRDTASLPWNFMYTTNNGEITTQFCKKTDAYYIYVPEKTFGKHVTTIGRKIKTDET